MSIGLFAQLVRFSHTLFALPFALSAMLLAADGLPNYWQSTFILACMVTARNAAMAFNRVVDADIDAQNPRTQGRHIPAGLLSKRSVWIFFAVNSLAFILFTGFLNTLALALSVPVLLLLCAYSLIKRFSWASHLFLGVAIGMSPLGAWVAVRGELALLPALLGLLLAVWIAGFDIIYACADEQVDKNLGLHSIPAKFGQANAFRLAMFLHFWIFPIAWAIYGVGNFSWFWVVGMLLLFLLLGYLHFFRKSSSLDKMNSDFFIGNVALSVVVLLAVALEVFV